MGKIKDFIKRRPDIVFIVSMITGFVGLVVLAATISYFKNGYVW